jgi:peptide/nickel transport system permease protein
MMPPIPFDTKSIDHSINAGKSPFDKELQKNSTMRHWLGTDKLGRDVAAGMVHGTSIALKIGLLSVFFASILGILYGLIAGYFQDNMLKTSIIELSLILLFLSVSIYYLFMETLIFRSDLVAFLLGLSMLFLIVVSIHHIMKRFQFAQKINIPADMILIKMIEVRKSFPGIFLLLVLINVFSTPSVWNIVVVITLLSWADFARLARAETLSIKHENFIINAGILGFSDAVIIFRHILPNIMPTLIVTTCFSIGSAVLLESTLSFLGIGLPVEEVTWGNLMAEGRSMKYWWLVVFPGLAIFILILALNTIASKWQKSNFTWLS